MNDNLNLLIELFCNYFSLKDANPMCSVLYSLLFRLLDYLHNLLFWSVKRTYSIYLLTINQLLGRKIRSLTDLFRLLPAVNGLSRCLCLYSLCLPVRTTTIDQRLQLLGKNMCYG